MAPIEDDHGGHRHAAHDQDDLPATGPYAHHPAALPRDSLSLRLGFPGALIDGDEDPGDWERYCADLVAGLQPFGPVEFELAETIARLGWRLRRIERLEAETLAGGFVRQVEEADAGPGRSKTTVRERLLAWITRHEGHLDRARYRARKELRTLQKERRAAGPAVESATTRDTMDTKEARGSNAGELGLFGRNAELPARGSSPESRRPLTDLASNGQNVGPADSSAATPLPVPEVPEDTKPTEGPDATQSGALGSIGKVTGPAPLSNPKIKKTDATGSTRPVTSFGQTAPDASDPPGGWLTCENWSEYVEEEGEEDEWTYSSYKSFWAERDAAEQAAAKAPQITQPKESAEALGSFGTAADPGPSLGRDETESAGADPMEPGALGSFGHDARPEAPTAPGPPASTPDIGREADVPHPTVPPPGPTPQPPAARPAAPVMRAWAILGGGSPPVAAGPDPGGPASG